MKPKQRLYSSAQVNSPICAIISNKSLFDSMSSLPTTEIGKLLRKTGFTKGGKAQKVNARAQMMRELSDRSIVRKNHTQTHIKYGQGATSFRAKNESICPDCSAQIAWQWEICVCYGAHIATYWPEYEVVTCASICLLYTSPSPRD